MFKCLISTQTKEAIGVCVCVGGAYIQRYVFGLQVDEPMTKTGGLQCKQDGL